MLTVCTSDVEWVEFEHFPKVQPITNLELMLKQKKQERQDDPIRTCLADVKRIESKLTKEMNLRRFKIAPKLFGKCKVNVAPNDLFRRNKPCGAASRKFQLIQVMLSLATSYRD